MWQYTDGNFGPQPHAVNGIGNCDRDKFNGTEDQLRTLWQGTS
jgi:lysozyme